MSEDEQRQPVNTQPSQPFGDTGRRRAFVDEHSDPRHLEESCIALTDVEERHPQPSSEGRERWWTRAEHPTGERRNDGDGHDGGRKCSSTSSAGYLPHDDRESRQGRDAEQDGP